MDSPPRDHLHTEGVLFPTMREGGKEVTYREDGRKSVYEGKNAWLSSSGSISSTPSTTLRKGEPGTQARKKRDTWMGEPNLHILKKVITGKKEERRVTSISERETPASVVEKERERCSAELLTRRRFSSTPQSRGAILGQKKVDGVRGTSFRDDPLARSGGEGGCFRKEGGLPRDSHLTGGKEEKGFHRGGSRKSLHIVKKGCFYHKKHHQGASRMGKKGSSAASSGAMWVSGKGGKGPGKTGFLEGKTTTDHLPRPKLGGSPGE